MTQPIKIVSLLLSLTTLTIAFLIPSTQANANPAEKALGDLKREARSVALSGKSQGIVVWSKGSLRTSLQGFQWRRLGPGLALVESDLRSDLRDLRKRDDIIAANPNRLGILHAALSSDPLGYRTWSFENRNRRYYSRGPYVKRNANSKKRSRRDSDIDLLKAWRIEKGVSGTNVAVIDTGIDTRHPDLAGQIWQNEDEVPDNGIDDDGNGFIDDTEGWNFADDSNDPWDDYGHGTHVAGTIGARTNNNKALPGINQEISIMPVKVFDASGSATEAQVASGILYAIENGARVINGSYGFYVRTTVINAIIRAHPEVLFIFSAGNDGANVGKKRNRTWPCLVNSGNNICVASTNARDQLSDFSNYNKKRVQIAAPGEDILSLVPFNQGCPGAPGEACQQALDFSIYNSPFSGWTHGGVGDDWGEASFSFIGELIPGLSDSVSGKYQANSNSWSLSPEISFQEASDTCLYIGTAGGKLESGEDIVRVSVSTDGGSTFSKVTSYTGNLVMGIPGWIEVPLALVQERMKSAEGQTSFRFKYTLTSDSDTEYAGATIIDSIINCQGSIPNVAVYSGTSMSSPHVTGVAALLLSHKPSATVALLRKALLKGSDKKKTLRGKVVGARRLNAYGALKALG